MFRKWLNLRRGWDLNPRSLLKACRFSRLIHPENTASFAVCRGVFRRFRTASRPKSVPALLLLFALPCHAYTALVLGQSNLTRDTGVADGFVSAMTAMRGEPVEVINCAVPDTRIAQHARSWVRSNIYADCLAKIGGRRIDGILWWQGENDTMQKGWALDWAKCFLAIVVGWRQDLGYSVPIAVAVLHNEANPPYPYWATVRALQAALEGPGVVLVSTEGVPYADKVHADYEGHVEIGKRFAEALTSLTPP